MKDKLERFVLDNRDDFDIFEPSPAVWNNITKKKKEAKIRKINWKGVAWKAAAAVLLFISSSIFTQHYLMPDNQSVAQQQEVATPELIDAEVYYASAVSNKLTQVKQYTRNYPEIEQELSGDLSELDSVYAELKEDLKENVATEEVVDALIQNYRIKLRILEDLLEQLQEVSKDSVELKTM